MVERELIDRLLSSVGDWNKWRKNSPNTIVKIQRASLIAAKLADANLSRVYLSYTDLSLADLRNTDLTYAHLGGADLDRADLQGANLAHADLAEADLSGANLCGANLSGSNLPRTLFRDTIITGADFSEARVGYTLFTDVSLSEAVGIDNCRHDGPSYVDYRTLEKSRHIPKKFLKGCGMSDWQIEASKLYDPNLSTLEFGNIVDEVTQLRRVRPIQIADLFISYSHKDSSAVDGIQSELNRRGIRSWRDIHDAQSGPLEPIVLGAMNNRAVLLVLSINSVNSDWVEHEARLARRIAKDQDRHVLCPIALDDAWKTCKWPERLREQIQEYNILDFSNWRDPELSVQFDRLVNGLGVYYAK